MIACVAANILAADAFGAPASGPDEIGNPIEIPRFEAFEHRAGETSPVYLKGVSQAFGIEFAIVVDRHGKVRSATPLDGVKAVYPAARAEALGWSYAPFYRNGVPITVKFVGVVHVLPTSAEASSTSNRGHEVPFPATDVSGPVQIRLERYFTECPDCGAYTVEITKDGTVTFTGNDGVAIPGHHSDLITADNIYQIIEKFRQADFYSLEDSYACGETIAVVRRVTSITVGDRTKRVVNYCDNPYSPGGTVLSLDAEILRISGAEKWWRGSVEAVASLRQEGFDFSSQEAVENIAHLAGKGTREGIRAYLAMGVPVTDNAWTRTALQFATWRDDRELALSLVEAGVGGENSVAQNQTLRAAAHRGNRPLFDALVRRGADPKSVGPTGQTVLMAAAHSANVGLIGAVLGAHPDVNAQDTRHRTAIFDAIPSGFDDTPSTDKDTPWASPAVIIRMLVAAGADPNHQDEKGLTPLHEAANRDTTMSPYALTAARTLVELGAKLTIRDAQGRTPLLAANSPETALMLIRAGADTSVRDNTRRSIRDVAEAAMQDSENHNGISVEGWGRVIRAIRGLR